MLKGHQQQKFKNMSKILKKYHPITQSSLKQIRQVLKEQIHQKKSFSIFDKLQIYDKIIGQFQVSRTDPQVLKIFTQLIVDHGQVYLEASRANFNGNFYLDYGKKDKNNYVDAIYSSPTYHKKQGNDVDDPQLFSFSKTRREVISNHLPNQVSSKLPAFSMFQKNKTKIKQNSDKPRYTAPVLTEPNERKVSQFNSELDVEKYDKVILNQKEDDEKSFASPQIEVENSSNSLHQLSRKLKLFLLTKNSKIFFRFLSNNLSKRKKQFKVKTSQFIYELKLLKKSWQSIKNFNNHTQSVIRQFRKKKNQEKLLNYFGEWYFYANRTEQQRQREKLVKLKQILLTKVINLQRFIKNSKVPIQQMRQENNAQLNLPSLRSYNQYLSKSIKSKSDKLKKVLLLKQVRIKLSYKNEVQSKKQELRIARKKNFYQLFVKLLECIKQTQRIKQGRLTCLLEYKIHGRRMINKLRGEYHFQKAYWADQNDSLKLGRRQQELAEFKLQQSKYQIIDKKKSNEFTHLSMLNPKYKKILFIYDIIDCVEHNLNRKGYTFLEDISSKIIEVPQKKNNSILQTLLQEHPAYKNYFKPYKLYKYFTALKKHLVEDKTKKINEIKYKINGKRVLHNGLLKWYKNALVKSVINQQIQNKTEILSVFLADKHRSEFFQLFGSKAKYFDKKSQVQDAVRSNKIIDALRTLKTYLVSKKYYRKIILQSKVTNRHKIQQNYFLEWKLLYAENVHNRLLEKDIENIRKKYAIKDVKKIISQFSLSDKIFKKKCKNLQRMRSYNYGDQFITLLRKNCQIQRNCSQNTKQQVQNKTLETEEALKTRQKGKFISQLMQYWYQCKLQREVIDNIDAEYQYRLLFKSFVCMKQMRKVQKQEQQKVNKIKAKRQNKIKRNTMGQFIDMLIKKILLKRMSTITKKYYFGIVKDCIFMGEQKMAKQN